MMTLEQQRAVAIAQARRARAEAEGSDNSQPERSMLEAGGREVALAARAGMKGLSMPASLLGDTLASGVNAATGSHIEMPSKGFDEFLTKMGSPEPENSVERTFGDLFSGASGGALAGPAAVLPGATGSAASGLTREAGGNQTEQVIAGLFGGGIPSIAKGVAQTAVAGTKMGADIIRPLTQAGRETIVGRTLRKEASTPDVAMQNLNTAPEFVPGSKPTSGIASKDPGLIGLERGMRNRKPTDFADVDTQNATARNKALNDVAGQPKDIVKAKIERSDTGDALRNDAFFEAKPTPFDSASKAIKEISESPDGVRDDVAKAMKWASKKLDDAVDPKTMKQIKKLTVQMKEADAPTKVAIKAKIQELKSKIDPTRLAAARDDIKEAISGKYDSTESSLKLAAKQLSKVRDALDADIQAGAPGYKKYLETFTADSKPITQMEKLQDIRQSAETSIPNPITDERGLSQPKWNNLVNKSRAENAKVLTPKQMQVLDNIASDLDRSATLKSFDASGSNTTSNLTMSNILGNIISGKAANSPFAKTVSRPLAWLYKIPEEDVQRLLLTAMKNPQTAATLMSKASAKASEPLSRQLVAQAKKMGIGVVAGAAESKPQEPETE